MSQCRCHCAAACIRVKLCSVTSRPKVCERIQTLPQLSPIVPSCQTVKSTFFRFIYRLFA